jgi:hypothetical protein
MYYAPESEPNRKSRVEPFAEVVVCLDIGGVFCGVIRQRDLPHGRTEKLFQFRR